MLKYNSHVKIACSFPGIPVIFLHAFPVDHRMWRPQFEFLMKKNVPYIAFDYPGFGESKILNDNMTIFDYGEIANGIIRNLNISKAVFVGLSMGGYVALNIYRKYPEIFAGLVLANTRAAADTDQIRENRFRLIKELKEKNDLKPIIDFHLKKFFTTDTREKNCDLMAEVEMYMKKSSIEGVITALKAMAHRPDSEELLPELPFPVKVIAGEKDELTTVEEAQRIASLLKKGSLSLIPGAAHLSNMEQPEKFNQVLAEYLNELNIN